MSFSIDSLLKRDDIRGKEKIRSETSSRMRRHFHYDLDDMGGVIAYRGESLTMKDHRHIKSKDVEFTRTDSEEHGYGESEDKATLGSGASDLSGGKMHRKRRILFTREQTHELQKVFQHQQYLTVPQRDYLSRKINLTPTQVKIWFQNHRYKLKKYVKECDNKNNTTAANPLTTKTPSSSPLPSIFRDLHHSDNPPRLSPPFHPPFRRSSTNERPTMFSFTKPYSSFRRRHNSPEPPRRRISEFHFLSSPPSRYTTERSRTSSSSNFRYLPACACCDCEKYTPQPPPLSLSLSSRDKWRRSESDPCSSSKQEPEEVDENEGAEKCRK